MPPFRHAYLIDALPDDWWDEAGMTGFVPNGLTFRIGPCEPRLDLERRPVLILPINDVEPLEGRRLTYGMFRDKESVLKILRGFRNGDAIPPIQVVKLPDGAPFSHRIYNGAHRFYCSVAAGFTHVPAIDAA